MKRWLRRSAGFLAGVAVLGVVADIDFRRTSEDTLASLPQGDAPVLSDTRTEEREGSVPGQVGAMLCWLSMQPWSDPRRISILGFSLGAIAAPAAERAAWRAGAEVRWMVLAYGGVGLDTMIDGNPRIKPAWIRPLLGAGIELLLRPLEPAEHLPRLTGHFLILTASGDTIIDPEASAGLEQLTPQPKTVIRTSGDHIGTNRDRQRLLQEAMTATRHWLISEGAVNAIEP